MARPRPTILQEIRENLPVGGRVLVAVSGGLDSMVLLHGVSLLRSELRLQIEVAHVDHGLRAESSGDRAFVQASAETFQFPFHATTLSAPPERQNVEAWGRGERYRFFGEVLRARGLEWTLTAHTASDVSETLLMRLVSNKALSTILRRDEKRKVLRPLLSVTRNEIESFAREHSVSHREDASNQDTSFLRNRIRHLLIPLLKKEFDPRIEEVLAHRAEVISREGEVLTEMATEIVSQIAGEDFGSRAWLNSLVAVLRPLPIAVQTRVIELLLKPVLGFNLGSDRCLDFVRFILSGAEGIQLPGGVEFRRRNGGVVVKAS